MTDLRLSLIPAGYFDTPHEKPCWSVKSPSSGRYRIGTGRETRRKRRCSHCGQAFQSGGQNSVWSYKGFRYLRTEYYTQLEVTAKVPRKYFSRHPIQRISRAGKQPAGVFLVGAKRDRLGLGRTATAAATSTAAAPTTTTATAAAAPPTAAAASSARTRPGIAVIPRSRATVAGPVMATGIGSRGVGAATPPRRPVRGRLDDRVDDARHRADTQRAEHDNDEQAQQQIHFSTVSGNPRASGPSTRIRSTRGPAGCCRRPRAPGQAHRGGSLIPRTCRKPASDCRRPRQRRVSSSDDDPGRPQPGPGSARRG